MLNGGVQEGEWRALRVVEVGFGKAKRASRISVSRNRMEKISGECLTTWLALGLRWWDGAEAVKCHEYAVR